MRPKDIIMLSAQSVKLSPQVVFDAKKNAVLENRSVPKQIEYFYQMGKIAFENPDLPMGFIKGAMAGALEIEDADVSDFEFRRK